MEIEIVRAGQILCISEINLSQRLTVAQTRKLSDVVLDTLCFNVVVLYPQDTSSR